MSDSEESKLQYAKLDGPINTVCMATSDEKCDFKPMKFQRRPIGEYDVLIDMKYCGVCHTDLHIAANHYVKVAPTQYPCVPGHELAGKVVKVGAKVTKLKVGMSVGVGYLVDTCGTCKHCVSGEEQNCKGKVQTTQGKVCCCAALL